ncbi:MAG: SAM-dependent chlorinase/fluorinase [Cyclobacteriaceae bacterium]|nr:SAM-dependent chlorinase/fluorinase [Cyclobacteriaceae bacterium]MCH8516038.1 SAM-dependent chlorinase/fluorinase [Cyclobacteriaceae bacterium]
MAIVSFTSDYGNIDPYVSLLKSAIWAKSPEVNFLDVSHDVHRVDVPTAAYFLEKLLNFSANGTIHLLAVQECFDDDFSLLIAQTKHQQYIITTDTGILPLVKHHIDQISRINPPSDIRPTFPMIDMAPESIAQLLHSKQLPTADLVQIDSLRRYMYNEPSFSDDQMVAFVIYVDEMGNLTTNLKQKDFLEFVSNRRYEVHVGRQRFKHIHHRYSEVVPGECFLIFNALGYLEIGIFQSSAEKLLGIKKGHKIQISLEGN